MLSRDRSGMSLTDKRYVRSRSAVAGDAIVKARARSAVMPTSLGKSLMSAMGGKRTLGRSGLAESLIRSSTTAAVGDLLRNDRQYTRRKRSYCRGCDQSD